jgi:hypothetical protein
MATRATIAVEHVDGTIDQIYCHWDGYPDWTGKLLEEHYDTLEKVEELVALGDLSSLGETIGTKHDFDARPKGECNFYGRDRGESDCRPRRFANFDAFIRRMQKEEYDYLYREGKWAII